jgi:hypothetical protein
MWEDEMKGNARFLALVLPAVLFSGCGGGPDLGVESRWSDEAVVMDGSADDWAGYPLEYSEEEQISLGVRNDDENVYLIFLSRDERLARRVLMGGMTLWFDPTCGQKKEFGVRYRGNRSLVETLRAGSDIPEMMRPAFQGHEAQVLDIVTVLDRGDETSLPEGNPVGPQAASVCEDGVYGYEFMIPIARSGDIHYAVEVSPSEKVSVCLELSGADRETRKRMVSERGEMTGPPPGGMGGGGQRPMGGGGRRGGGPRGGPRGDGEEMMRSQEIWVMLHLAQMPPVQTEDD